jgi:uncharacterized membrane protein
MKKIRLVIVLLISILLLTGCEEKENKDPNALSWLKEITGEIIKASFDKDGNIIINKKDITENAVYISYEYEGVTIGLIAVKDSKGDIKVVVNTCQACGGSPYAYFVQVRNKVQCQNCGNYFEIDELDNLEEDGCNPIGIEERTDTEETIVIGTEQLKELKDKFENWKGPKYE